MRKTVNLTVRITPELKRNAELACEYLDRNLSEIVRHSLHDLVRQHHKSRAKDTGFARMFMEGELAEQAQRALLNELKAKQKLNGSSQPATLNHLITGNNYEESEQVLPHDTEVLGMIDVSEMSVKERQQLHQELMKSYLHPSKASAQSSPPTVSEEPGIKFTENGHIDKSTMSRKQRRAYERDLNRGALADKPLSRVQPSTLTSFSPEERLRELLQKEEKSFLTRQERDQKNALLKAGLMP